MFKKMMVVLLIVTLSSLMFGCTPENNNSEANEADDVVLEEPTKVALLLPGPISDMSWNAFGYSGLMRIEDGYDNVETSYVESLAKSDYEEVFIGYAEQGYDLLMGHGFSFSDAANSVAAKYPDVQFMVIGGVSTMPNVTSINVDNMEQGFMAGVVAGFITETGIIGGIGGTDAPPIQNIVKGFVAGAKYVNPEIEAITAMTGNMTDAHQAKEIGISMAQNGADVILGAANVASLGIIEAAEENDISFIGINEDMRESAPGIVVQSALSDGGVMFTYIFDLYLEGNLEGVDLSVGMREGALSLIPWDDSSDIPSETIEKIKEVLVDLESGGIDYVGLSEEIVIK